jgi:hypothetical protein
MKRLALFIVFPLIFGFGNDKARLCEDLKFAINKSKNDYQQKISFAKQSKEFANDKITKIYAIETKWEDLFDSPYEIESLCNEYFLIKEFDIDLSSECYLFETILKTILKTGNYSDEDFDFMTEERRQNAQALIEEFKAKYDQINKQAIEDYLSEQKEMQKIYRKKKCD